MVIKHHKIAKDARFLATAVTASSHLPLPVVKADNESLTQYLRQIRASGYTAVGLHPIGPSSIPAVVSATVRQI